MIEAKCHCGSVRLTIDAELPETLLSCNCSICRRYGALMAYFQDEHVAIAAGETHRYVHGDRMIAFVRCAECGVFTHWESLEAGNDGRMGINMRNVEAVDIWHHPVRKFDGAETWTVVD